MLSKQLFRGYSLSFNESTAYLLFFQCSTTKKMLFYKRSNRFFVTGVIQLTALLIHSYSICKRRLSINSNSMTSRL